jgi:hypothetical protein
MTTASGRLPQDLIKAVEMFLGPDHMAIRTVFVAERRPLGFAVIVISVSSGKS